MYILNIEETLCGFSRRQSVVKAQPVAGNPGSVQCTKHGRSDDPPVARHHFLMTFATGVRFLSFRRNCKISLQNDQTPQHDPLVLLVLAWGWWMPRCNRPCRNRSRG